MSHALVCLSWFAAAAAASFLLGWGVRRWLKGRGVVDVPNARSSHVQPTVRGGGIAIVLVVGLGLAALALTRPDRPSGLFLGPLVLVALVSFVDDLRSVSAQVRLAAQLVAAVLAMAVLGWTEVRLSVGSGPVWLVPAGLAGALGTIWLAGYANAFNFMDGINGHAALQAVITAAAGAVLAGLASQQWTAAPVLASVLVAGAVAGFVPFNFPRAQVFMGDVGSVSLGFTLGFLVLWQAQRFGWDLLVPLVLLHFNFVFDAGVTLARRILQREPWLEPHREHFYERLAQATRSHVRVTTIEMAIQLAAVGLLVASVTGPVRWRWVLAGSVVCLWLAYFTGCELYCRGRGLGFRAVRPTAGPGPRQA